MNIHEFGLLTASKTIKFITLDCLVRDDNGRAMPIEDLLPELPSKLVGLDM